MTGFAEWPERRYLRSLSPEMDGQEVVVSGWVEDIRNLGGIAFILLREKGGVLQVTAKKEADAELFRRLTRLPRESVIAVKGTIRAEAQAAAGFEIAPSEVEVLSEAATPLPLGVVDKVGAELDTRLDNRILDMRKPAVRAMVVVRGLGLEGLRAASRKRDFVEVHTPKMLGAGAEGGATMFEVDYFGRTAYLAQSPQLYKQMLMGTGLDRIFEIAQVFRAELSDTTRHVTEITMFDGEVAFIRDQEDFLRLLEAIVVETMAHIRDKGAESLESLDVDFSVPELPIPRITYVEAVDLLAAEGKELPVDGDIDTEGEKLLGKIMAERGVELYFIKDYPSEVKPFYIMEREDDRDYTHSFDLAYRGVEWASGGQREHRYDRLVSRMKAQDLDPSQFEFYLSPFRYGMPPHGGWGFGVDRMVQVLLGFGNIREAILFPRDRSRLVP
jgi:aspartyl-tRNA synthetase